MKKKETPKDTKIRLLEEELKFAILEISRLETQLRILKTQVKDTELRNGNPDTSNFKTINAQLRGIVTGQYGPVTVSCSALRRSKDTNR